MARRHSNSEYNFSARGQQQQQGDHSSEWWEHNRPHGPHLYSESYYAHDRRGSAPDYLFPPSSPSYSSSVGHSPFPNTEPAYTATSQPVPSELSTNQSSSHNSSLRGSNPTQDQMALPHRDALVIHRPYRGVDAMHERLSLGCRNSSLGDGHDAEQTISSSSLNNPASPQSDLSREHRGISRYEEASYGACASPVDDDASMYQSMSPETGSPRFRTTPDSQPERSLDNSIATDQEEEEALQTRTLAGPGCYVLVPPNHVPGENTRHVDDAKYHREKKVLSAKKGFRKPVDEAERQAIKLNRKLGVCLRCKIFKEKCRGGIPCERCRGLGKWKSICVPAQFTEKAVFNRSTTPNRVLEECLGEKGTWGYNGRGRTVDHILQCDVRYTPSIYRDMLNCLLENISDLDQTQSDFVLTGPQDVEAHNGYNPKLKLRAYTVSPHDGRLLSHILWRVTGTPDFNPFPSTYFGLKELPTANELDSYLDQHVDLILRKEIQPAIAESELHQSTINAVCDYGEANKGLSNLVKKALRIYVAQTIFFRNAWRICGPNTLGMHPIDNSTSKLHGLIPLPRLISKQLDSCMENRVANLEKELLGELQTRILDRNSNDWFGIYLTIYMQLSSLERDTWDLHTWEHDSERLRGSVETLNPEWHTENRAFVWPLRDPPSDYIAKNMYLAQILFCHFRAISKGSAPFSLNWDSTPVRQMAGDEAEAVQYMKHMSRKTRRFERYLRSRQAAQYSRADANSLDGLFTAGLMLSEEVSSTQE